MYIAIIFITLTFIFIILNIINNKKISLLSFLFFIILVGYYICYIRQLEIYYKFVEKINNIDLYFKIFCIISMITAFLEYLLSYKRRLQKNIKQEEKLGSIKQEEKLGSIKQEEKLNQSINDVLIFVELHDEPIGYLSNNMYIINNKLKKIINYDNNVISKQDFCNYINYNDKFKLNEKVKNIIFRFKHNNEKWFELISLDINNNEYKLIRPTNINRENQKINLKTYKDLNNDTKHFYT